MKTEFVIDSQSHSYKQGKQLGAKTARSYWHEEETGKEKVARKVAEVHSSGNSTSWVRQVENETKQAIEALSHALLQDALRSYESHVSMNDQNMVEFAAGFAMGVKEVVNERRAEAEKQFGYKFGVQYRHLAELPEADRVSEQEFAARMSTASGAFKQGVEDAFDDSRRAKKGSSPARYIDALGEHSRDQAIQLLINTSTPLGAVRRA